MSKALAEFHDLLLPELPGCGVDMVNLQLRQTAREFCVKTGAWRLPFDALDLVAGQATYYPATPEIQSELVRFTRLMVNDDLLWDDTDHEQRDASVPEPKYNRNEPPFTLSPDLQEFTLIADEVPTADVAAGLVLTGAMKPTLIATTLPDFLLSQYSDAMRFGTLSRLMVMAKKPWTDRALATAYLGEWNKALNFAAYQVQVGNTRQQLRVKTWDSPRYRHRTSY